MSQPADDRKFAASNPASAEPARSAHFLQTLIRTASEGICVCAESQEYPFIVFSVWNERMTELTGYSMPEINRIGWYQSMYRDEAEKERAIARRERVLAGDEMREEEWTIVRKDGRQRVVAISTSRVSLEDHTAAVAFVSDITDRKNAEKAVRESQCRLNLAQRLARLGCWEWDFAAGSLWWSEELFRLSGADPATFVPTAEAAYKLIHPDDLQLVVETVRRCVADGKPYSFRMRIVTADEKVRWQLAQGILDRFEDGMPKRLRGTLQDITEQVESENAQRAMEEELRDARQLESIGVLAAGIAHEFNNLLTTILGHAELAGTEPPGSEALHGHLEPIKNAGQRAAELCRQMLAYAGKGRFAIGTVDLRAMASDCRQRSAQPDIILIETDPVPTLVRGDAEQLRQLACSLLANALESGGGGVRVTIGLESLDEIALDRLHFSGALQPGRYAFLQVQDDGAGMDAATLNRAFEPFFTTKFPGRGLGLPVVLGVVRTHGGGLHIESAPKNGTTIRVYLPPA